MNRQQNYYRQREEGQRGRANFQSNYRRRGGPRFSPSQPMNRNNHFRDQRYNRNSDSTQFRNFNNNQNYHNPDENRSPRGNFNHRENFNFHNTNNQNRNFNKNHNRQFNDHFNNNSRQQTSSPVFRNTYNKMVSNSERPDMLNRNSNRQNPTEHSERRPFKKITDPRKCFGSNRRRSSPHQSNNKQIEQIVLKKPGPAKSIENVHSASTSNIQIQRNNEDLTTNHELAEEDDISIAIGEFSCSDCDDLLYDDLILEDDEILTNNPTQIEGTTQKDKNEKRPIVEDNFDQLDTLEQLQNAIDSITNSSESFLPPNTNQKSPNFAKQTPEHIKNMMSPKVMLNNCYLTPKDPATPISQSTPVRENKNQLSPILTSSLAKNQNKMVPSSVTKSAVKRKNSDIEKSSAFSLKTELLSPTKPNNKLQPTSSNKRKKTGNNKYKIPLKSHSHVKIETSDDTDSFKTDQKNPSKNLKRKKINLKRSTQKATQRFEDKILENHQKKLQVENLTPSNNNPKSVNHKDNSEVPSTSSFSKSLRNLTPENEERRVVMKESNHDMRISVSQDLQLTPTSSDQSGDKQSQKDEEEEIMKKLLEEQEACFKQNQRRSSKAQNQTDNNDEEEMMKKLLEEQEACFKQNQRRYSSKKTQNQTDNNGQLNQYQQEDGKEKKSSSQNNLKNVSSDLEEGEILEKNEQNMKQGQSQKLPEAELAKLDEDYDKINNMYAPDEDCMSQYLTDRNTQQINMMQQSSNKPCDKNNNVNTRGSIHNQIAFVQQPTKTNAGKAKSSFNMVLNLLKADGAFQTLIATDNFFKIFSELNFNGNPRSEGQILIMRLTAKLSKFNKMIELEKVVGLALTKDVIVNENTLDHLFQFFIKTSQYNKIVDTIEKIKNQKLMTPRAINNLNKMWGKPVNNSHQLNQNRHQGSRNNRSNNNQPNQRQKISPNKINPRNQSPVEGFKPSRNFQRPALLSTNTLVNGNCGSLVNNNDHRAFIKLKQNQNLEPGLVPNPTKNSEDCKFQQQKLGSSNFKSRNNNSKNIRTQFRSSLSPSIGKNILNFRLQDSNENNIGTNSTKIKSVTIRIKEAVKCHDWCSLGRNFGEFISVVGSSMIKDEILKGFIEILTLTQNSNAIMFFEFEKSATLYITQNCPEEIELMKYCLTRIALSLIYSCNGSFAYEVLMHMHKTKMDYVTNIGIISNSKDKIISPCGNAMKFIKICMQVNDLDMAATFAKEFFIENKTKIVNLLEKDFQELLENVAGNCIAKQQYSNAVVCLQVIPIWCSEGSVNKILKNLLKTFLNSETILSKNILSLQSVVDMMLNRKMLLAIRNILNEVPINNNSLTFFEYMETKGIYAHPKVHLRPHLVLIPYTMSPIEMSLIVCRHLMELAEFLIEIKEKLKPDLPFKIVLIKSIGNLMELQPLSGKKDSYSVAKDQLLECLQTVLKPPLSVADTQIVNSTKETLVIVDLKSVGDWMIENTSYIEDKNTGENNQMVMKQNMTESVMNILSSEISELKKGSTIPLLHC